MITQEVAHKYAHGLFLSAKERNLIDQAYEQFAGIKQLLMLDFTLMNFLNAPQVPDPQKTETIKKVFGPRLHPLFVEFLLVLLRKRRIRYLPLMIDEFIHLVEDAKGISRAEVISAVSLDATEQKNLIASLEKKTGRKIILESKVDPTVLGGMIVLVQGEILDGSVRHQLDLIREQLEKVKVH